MIVGAALAIGAATFNQIYHDSGSTSAPMPNGKLTPGAVFKDITAKEICVKGYAQKVRNVTQGTKNRIYKSYGITSHKPGQYEIDHLISLELGGTNDEDNLWPQPYHGSWNAHHKDALENKLHQMVCEGLITLEEAQREISTNWVEAYEKYISN